MKKIMFLSMLAAIMGLASCSSDESVAESSRTQTAQITLTLPDDIATIGNSTRADNTADYVNSAKGGVTNQQGKNINFYVQLYYGNKVVFQGEKPCTVGAGKPSVTFSPTVVMGEEYKIVAWAEFGDAVSESETTCSKDLTAIDITQALNDESKDGYFCSEDIQAAQSMSATLKRPYGKLRLVAEDYAEMNKQTGKTVKSVTVTYNTANPYSSFDATTGKFSGEGTTKEFTANLKTYSEETIAEGATVPTAQTLCTAYIPVAADGTTLCPFEIKVTYDDGNGNTSTFTRSFSEDIPVKRNYLTTLTGDFFTSKAKLALIVDEDFGGTNPVEYKFVDASTFTSSDNIDMTDENVIIDLDGKTVEATSSNVKSIKAKSITIQNGTVNQKISLTATDGDIVLKDVNVGAEFNTSDKVRAITAHGKGALVIDGIDFTTSKNVYNGLELGSSNDSFTSVTIKNCKFDCKKMNVLHNPINVYSPADGAVINIEDCEILNMIDDNAVARFSNYNNAQNVTINFKNCKFSYDSSIVKTQSIWFALFVFEHTAKTLTEETLFKTWTVNINNCTNSGTAISADDFKATDTSRIVYIVFIDNYKTLNTSIDHFQTDSDIKTFAPNTFTVNGTTVE